MKPPRRVDGPAGIEYELVEGAVGNTGTLSCVMGEIVHGMKVIKMYGWEYAFSDKISEARK